MARTVTAKVVGGLGNQIFIYAAARTLALRLRAELCLDVSSYRSDLGRLFRLDRLRIDARINSPPQGTKPLHRQTWWRRNVSSFGVTECLRYSEPHFHYDPVFSSLSAENVRLDGYFQSHRYFEAASEQICSDMRLSGNPSVDFESFSRLIDACDTAISVHVRRGDYISDPNASDVHNSIGIDYYHRAISLTRRILGPQAFIFFFSDDPDYVRTHFGHIEASAVLPANHERPEEDLLLMARCKHNIIANSTFSWWAAWLNQNPTKVVVAPAQWFTRHHQLSKNPMDLFPHDWILIP